MLWVVARFSKWFFTCCYGAAMCSGWSLGHCHSIWLLGSSHIFFIYCNVVAGCLGWLLLAMAFQYGFYDSVSSGWIWSVSML